MDTPQKPERSPMEKARAQVSLALFLNGKMTDEFLPQDQFVTFLDKPFPEWPKELQDKLRPYGAEMIR